LTSVRYIAVHGDEQERVSSFRRLGLGETAGSTTTTMGTFRGPHNKTMTTAEWAEREADRVARRVMRTSELELSDSSRPLRTPEPPRTGSTVDGGRLPPIVDDVVSSPGIALEAAARTFLEPRFGHDLGRIRIHADPLAARSAAAVDAPAYTVGHDVVFAAGRFAPHTNHGMALLAHEIAHTLAPAAGTDGPRISRSEIPMPLEMVTEAQVGQVFDRIAAGSGVQVVSEVPIAVRDQAGNWVIGRIDRIAKLPDGTIIGVELKLDVTSSKTSAQVIYIKLANQGYVVEITGHAAGTLGVPQGTRLTLPIRLISSENVASAMESLGLRPPPSIAAAVVRVPGGRTPRAPSAFAAAPESAEQVPRSPSTVRTGTPQPGAVVPPGPAEQTVPVVARPSSKAAPPSPATALTAPSTPSTVAVSGSATSPSATSRRSGSGLVGGAANAMAASALLAEAAAGELEKAAVRMANAEVAADFTPEKQQLMEANPTTHGAIVTRCYFYPILPNLTGGFEAIMQFRWASVDIVEGATREQAKANLPEAAFSGIPEGTTLVFEYRWTPPLQVDVDEEEWTSIQKNLGF
jgi:hypothetical protein